MDGLQASLGLDDPQIEEQTYSLCEAREGLIYPSSNILSHLPHLICLMSTSKFLRMGFRSRQCHPQWHIHCFDCSRDRSYGVVETAAIKELAS